MTPARALLAPAAAVQTDARCRFCGLPADVDGRGPLCEYPGRWLPGVLMHAGCDRDTRRGALD